MQDKWRLIDSGFSSGVYNMAVDKALFEKYERGASPVFRVYGWRPSAISIGRFQNPSEFIDMRKCAEKGVSVVRRITGGGAIFHDEEITYSFVCGDDIFSGLSVKESYKKINRFLVDIYNFLKIPAGYCADLEKLQHPASSDFCFAGREPFDIVSDGLKIGGNAQRRSRGKIFQHGSIPLKVNLKKVSEYFVDRGKILRSPAKGLCDLGARIDFEGIKRILIEKFFENLNADFFPCQLTDEEVAATEEILKEGKICEKFSAVA
ncbi:MAG: lipoate--protein ligase family protein [Elusimicrobia bacterium]|nr:lipoate--protein ligase family protein [Elusimicrobiota bacterium]